MILKNDVVSANLLDNIITYSPLFSHCCILHLHTKLFHGLQLPNSRFETLTLSPPPNKTVSVHVLVLSPPPHKTVSVHVLVLSPPRHKTVSVHVLALSPPLTKL